MSCILGVIAAAVIIGIFHKEFIYFIEHTAKSIELLIRRHF